MGLGDRGNTWKPTKDAYNECHLARVDLFSVYLSRSYLLTFIFLPLGGVPTDEEQATGLEREIMIASEKGLVRKNPLCPLEPLDGDGIRGVSCQPAFGPGNPTCRSSPFAV